MCQVQSVNFKVGVSLFRDYFLFNAQRSSSQMEPDPNQARLQNLLLKHLFANTDFLEMSDLNQKSQ